MTSLADAYDAQAALVGRLRKVGGEPAGYKIGLTMTGSLIPTQFPKGPCRYRFTIAGIGAVEVVIVA